MAYYWGTAEQSRRFPLHSVILESLEEGLLRQEFSPTKLNEVTVKAIYVSRAEDIIPPPKVETEFPGVDFCDTVFPRLCHPVLEPVPKDVVFCVAHGLIRNRALQTEKSCGPLLSCPRVPGEGPG